MYLDFKPAFQQQSSWQLSISIHIFDLSMFSLSVVRTFYIYRTFVKLESLAINVLLCYNFVTSMAWI